MPSAPPFFSTSFKSVISSCQICTKRNFRILSDYICTIKSCRFFYYHPTCITNKVIPFPHRIKEKHTTV